MSTKISWTFTSELSFSSSRAVGHSNCVLYSVPTDWNPFFVYKAWRLAFKVTIHTFADMFGDVIKKLERSRELLLHSANIAHYQEAQAHYKEVQSFRLLFAQEFEAQLERTRNDRKLMVMNWLSSTSCDVDHEELQRKRNEFPDTARWIFKEDSMCRWLQPDGISNPMFWICGIPGAGS